MRYVTIASLLLGVPTPMAVENRPHHHSNDYRHLIRGHSLRGEECVYPLHFYVLGFQRNSTTTVAPRADNRDDELVRERVDEKEVSVSFRLVDLDTGIDTMCVGKETTSSSTTATTSTAMTAMTMANMKTTTTTTSEDGDLDPDYDDEIMRMYDLAHRRPGYQAAEEDRYQQSKALLLMALETAEQQRCDNDKVGFYLDDRTGLTVVEKACLGKSSAPVEAAGSVPLDALKLQCATTEDTTTRGDAAVVCKSGEQVVAGDFVSLGPPPVPVPVAASVNL
ncbi:uncharacterized protein B0I36DRAFT_360503 [Microdochium trichocladiopsis]|uniref:Uncharacterized protein n=1 Tax=Microdochium trichocladiopsis TaxID=1682393 RepID=A0A9P8YAZ2_9PEZI|nr:uncharacterized protein B0I36DRAFT_360503 [Microdochium trichocladiopsis]KAH7035061.1 hypothetical protein B0I36DRAFT_360503 [Microdochium trichocladiopsis]